MPVRDPINSFGLHQATIIDRSTFDMSRLVILGDLSVALGGENIPLRGGSSPYPWDTAQGEAEAEISVEVRQYHLSGLKYLIGENAVTPNFTENASGDGSGDVSALVNRVGTSVFNATTGVATASIKSGEDPAFGNYLVKATGADAVDVYLDNNLSGVEYQDDNLKITASALTIVASDAVEIPNVNLELNGGSGTIALTTGDIAEFSVRPINDYNFEFKGTNNLKRPYFTLRVFTEVLGNGGIRYIEFPKVQAGAFNYNQAVKDWATFETSLMILNDATKGYAWKMGIINPN